MPTGTYRAVVCPTLSANAEDGIASLRVVSQPRASLAEDEVRIAVKAAALNFFGRHHRLLGVPDGISRMRMLRLRVVLVGWPD